MPLSEAKITELWEEREELEARIAKLQAKSTKIKDRVIKEMKRRRVKSLTFDNGLSLTLREDPYTTIHMDAILAALTPSKRKLVMKEVPDTGLLSQAVQAGKIPARLVQEHSETKKKAPWIVPSRKKS